MSFAIEGAVCLAMCVPIAIPLAIVGVAVGRSTMSLSQPVRRTVTMLLVDLGYRPCYCCDGSLGERYSRAICCCDVGGGGCPTRSRLDECCRIFRASRPDRMDLSPGHRVFDSGADRRQRGGRGSILRVFDGAIRRADHALAAAYTTRLRRKRHPRTHAGIEPV